ncbi:uncharacterized protein C8A04DRAFT_31006 [Dichotomopilus funicola]|uniref:Uncharacterized protein n=1 Tax=Dichotomopilus funicola TaxID=1934379 RepID=A0AAN6V0P7_9PEZI|nr:hypothetical protein C8A04DRAFT_31006 [Dichotomopilus funicola]
MPPRPSRGRHYTCADSVFSRKSLPTDEGRIVSRRVDCCHACIMTDGGFVFACKLDDYTREAVSDWVMVYWPPDPDPIQSRPYPFYRLHDPEVRLIWARIDKHNLIRAAFNRKPPKSTRHLVLIAERQGEDEPKHWSLFSHFPNVLGTGGGEVWQITTGGGEMYFEHLLTEADPNPAPGEEGQLRAIDRMRSSRNAWDRVLAKDMTDSQRDRVDEIAREEVPPLGDSWMELKAGSQGWTIRVVERLMEEGIVGESQEEREMMLEEMEKLRDPMEKNWFGEE